MTQTAPTVPAVPGGQGGGGERVRTVDALRGVAAFVVTWHHFTGRDTDFLPEGWLKSSGSYGWLGVETFFVLSGFVIPWAMAKAGCRFADTPRFLLKRLMRLHPPFLASIVFALFSQWIEQQVYGRPFPARWADVALHVVYLNELLGRPWVNTVYWTLAVEVQYYATVALLAGGLLSPKPLWRRASLAAFAALTFLDLPGRSVCEFALLFVMGISTFQRRAGHAGLREHLLVLAVATVGLCFVKPPEVVATGTATALALTFLTLEHPILLFLGKISYSLYLVHGPIGGQMMLLADRLELGNPARVALLFGTTAFTIAFAWVFYRLIERPAAQWASSLPYRRAAAAA